MKTIHWIDFGVIAFAAIGQTVFLVMWAVMPWWREWIGRALMFKAVALFLLLWSSLIFVFFPVPYWVNVAIHILIALAIWSQVVALRREARLAKKHEREVSGTRHPGEDGSAVSDTVDQEG